MTIASDLIQAAYREGNLIPVGKSPTTDEQTEALDRLNGYINGVFGNEVGENLADWEVPAPQRTAPIAANFPQLPYPQNTAVDLYGPAPSDITPSVWQTPPKNSRIIFGGSVDQTVYFPESPNDGSRMSLISGASLVDGTVLTISGNGRKIEGVASQEFTAPFDMRQWIYRADLGDRSE